MPPYPKPDKTIKKKRKVKNERKELIKRCDALVREIAFKLEDTCFVTGVKAGRWHPQENPNGLQLSHFVTRTVFPLRWDLDNCHLTTAAVNYSHENNSLPYTLAMIKNYQGNQILNTLNQKWQEYKITGKTMPTWQIREKRDELQATLDALNGERTTL